LYFITTIHSSGDCAAVVCQTRRQGNTGAGQALAAAKQICRCPPTDTLFTVQIFALQ